MTGKKQQPKANEAIDLMNNWLFATDAPEPKGFSFGANQTGIKSPRDAASGQAKS